MLKFKSLRYYKRMSAASALTGLALNACAPDPAQQAPIKIEAPASTQTETLVQTQAQAAMTLPSYNGDFVWDIDHQASHITFTAMQGKTEIKGRFERFDAAIKLDPDHPHTGRIDAVINLSSVRTGDSEKDGYLAQKEWFGIDIYPLARFTSEQISRQSGNSYLAQGPLEIKGKSTVINLPFTLSVTGETAMADGTFEIDRSDFSIGSGPYADDDLLGQAVTITIHIKAIKISPE